VFVLSNLLPAGSHAEVTALATGRTLLVAVRGAGTGLADLSSDAASQLGITDAAPVRIRRVTASPADARALASGQTAPLRADAPPALLAGLRRQLGEAAPAASKPMVASEPPPSQPIVRAAKPSPAPAPAPVASTGRGLFVQVAALSNLGRAQGLAKQLGGRVRSAGAIHRVQLGPFPDKAAAQRARGDVASRGYGDARIISLP